MIEKLKLEPYIPESLVVHAYSKDGHLVAERYDTIYWVRDDFINVACDSEFNCYVDAKLFCTFAPSLKKVSVKDTSLRVTLFNGAKYDLDMVKEESVPTFEFPELKNKDVFNFGGVESAVSKSPLQKELNTVYVDKDGSVASDSIVAGVSDKFTSKIPFAVPEGIHSMLNGAEAEWDIIDGKLYIAFGVYKIVAVLSKLPDFAWWDASRSAFADLPEFTDVTGFRSSVTRLANFGTMVYIRDGRIAVNKDHWEPFALEGSGEIFDVSNLLSIATDDKAGAALVDGNMYLKTVDATFVCCCLDVNSPEAQEDFDEEPPEVEEAKPKKKATKKSK